MTTNGPVDCATTYKGKHDEFEENPTPTMMKLQIALVSAVGLFSGSNAQTLYLAGDSTMAKGGGGAGSGRLAAP